MIRRPSSGPRQRAFGWLLLGTALVASAGCAASTARNPFDPQASQGGQDRLRVEVQNLNFNDVTVWALRQSQRIRVGRVTGKTDQVFNIQWNIAEPIAFEVDVVAGRGCVTGQVPVDENARVWLFVPSDVGLGQCRAGRR